MNFFKISNGKNINYDIFITKNYTFINNTNENENNINIIDSMVNYYINKNNNGVRVLPKTRTRKKS